MPNAVTIQMNDYNALCQQWNDCGWVRVDNLIPERTVAYMSEWVNWISTQPVGDAEERQHYYEQTDQGVVLCRTERYLHDHQQLRDLIMRGPVLETATKLLGEQAVLYKEKVNYKQPGGAGFAAHQDASAYKYVNHHITCLIAVDPMTPENGCLELARGSFSEPLPENGDGCLSDDLQKEFAFDPVPMVPGQVLYFSSYVPHRSGSNHTADCRRALYLTYNALSEGDQRAAYYADRDKHLAQVQSGEVSRISTIGHFQGRTPETRP